MNITSVKINNILSIENAVVNFSDSGLMLVSGWNHDSGRANGAGKTAIFNAITFALYDKLPRKITATEILRRGAKIGSAEVSVNVGDSIYIVRRSRPKDVAFFKDGVKVNMTQEEWEHTLGLSYAQYLIAVYCSQGSSSRFLSINDSEKKQFILELLNLETFSSCKTIVDSKLKDLHAKLSSIESSVSSTLAKIDAYTESLVDEKEISQEIENNNKLAAQLNADIILAQKVQQPDLTKYDSVENNISTKRLEFFKAKTTRDMLHTQYKRLSSKIKPFDSQSSCSVCGSKLDNSTAKHTHENEIKKITEELNSIKADIDACDVLLDKEHQVNDLANKLKDKKKEESKEYIDAVNRIRELESKLQVNQLNNKNLVVKLQNNSVLLNKIKDLRGSLAKLDVVRSGINSEIQLYNTVSAMYSTTGAQAYVLDSVVESFNQCITGFINLLWSNVSYQLKSYKENVRGDVTAKFSEQLIMDGKEVSIGSLSGGEFRALSLCVDFALIQVMEKQFGISVNPIILDEPFDGLDDAGRELIIELLNDVGSNKQIVVVDHASEVAASFNNVLRVEKRNGTSTVSPVS